MRTPKRTIRMDVTNPKSIEKTIKYFEKMREEFPKKVQQLVTELADMGIRVSIASAGGSELAPYVVFSKEIKHADDSGCQAIMFGRDVGQVFGEGVDAPQISPILMIEYGSGFGADKWQIVDGLLVGQGTFPGQKHAFDPKGWFYRDSEGNLHHSMGETAQYPMQRAYDYMQTQVDNTIRKVFGL